MPCPRVAESQLPEYQGLGFQVQILDYAIIVTRSNVFLHLILKNWKYTFYSLSLKQKWVYSLQYLFYHFLYMPDMIPVL